MARATLGLVWLLLTSCGDDDAEGPKTVENTGPDMFGNAPTGPDGGSNVPNFDANVPEPTCGSEPFDATAVPPNVLLVIDKSGSMNDTPDGFSSDKWSSLKSSLEAAVAAVQDQLSLGLSLFPYPDGCQMPADTTPTVPIKPGPDALPEILAALGSAVPAGGTPTAAALAAALDYFQSGAGAQLTGDRYVLLATDGGPNCDASLSCGADTCTVNLDGVCPAAVDNCCAESVMGQEECLDADNTRAQIDALAAAGVQTLVVGIPGSEIYQGSLDSFAQSGGRANPDAPPSYYAVNTSGEDIGGLTTVLREIAEALIRTCRLQLGSEPDDRDKLNVEVDGEVVPRGKSGWQLDESTDPPTVVMQGNVCGEIEAVGAKNVTVTFGCKTVIE
ncbi:MAG: hypothetical protein OEZ06_25385 [Myxococcales bacterium]|nr:hypothetical protein [Myxococcales bacterium]